MRAARFDLLKAHQPEGGFSAEIIKDHVLQDETWSLMIATAENGDCTTMNVQEIFGLADWYAQHGVPASKLYDALHKTLQHNATQNQKQPVKAPLDALVARLRDMPLMQLNMQQMQHLDYMDIGALIGIRGAEFVQKVVTEASYDPATSASEIQRASEKVKNTGETLQSLTGELMKANFEEHSLQDQDGEESLARIHFRQEASISNVADMKKWASDWNDIVRGVGHLTGARPDDLRVVGASNGSIIISVSGAIGLISALAIMSKKVSGIVLDALKVMNSMEDLRHKRYLNSTVEKALLDEIKKKESDMAEELLQELKAKAVGKFADENEAHLKLAVKKFIAFSKSGGEVDFLEPPHENESEEDQDLPDTPSITSELRGLIEEIRSIKAETLLLEDQSFDQ